MGWIGFVVEVFVYLEYCVVVPITIYLKLKTIKNNLKQFFTKANLKMIIWHTLQHPVFFLFFFLETLLCALADKRRRNIES